MKLNVGNYLAFMLLLAIGVSGLCAQEGTTMTRPDAKVLSKSESQTVPAIIGFEDKNKDGINDKFCDANGDGNNDVTNTPYPHKFAFEDKDGDGINDIWQDVDGDGLNDGFHKMKKSDKSHIENVVLDNNADGKNDITGETVDLENPHKQNVGFWDETTGRICGRFIDEDGNGMDDRLERIRHRQQVRNRDFFVDEDGDGICDGRDESLKRSRRRERGKDR